MTMLMMLTRCPKMPRMREPGRERWKAHAPDSLKVEYLNVSSNPNPNPLKITTFHGHLGPKNIKTSFERRHFMSY